MPHAVASSEVEHAQRCIQAFQILLQAARQVRRERGIEHALNRTDFGDGFRAFENLSSPVVVDVAARDVFYGILGSTPFESPEFIDMWNLLDLCQIFSDDGTSESGLTFWLVEELLESLLVAQCRSVFDFLEIRREIMTAKHMDTKKLIILRACNELLKRLSKAEDTAFSGRVFIYLFQSLDFGDRSSVNLRGVFHVENATTYDEQVGSEDVGAMEIEVPAQAAGSAPEEAVLESTATPDAPSVNPKSAESPQVSMDMQQLYPVFWSIQKYFCQPTLLFDAANFTGFKTALEATLQKFKEVQKENTGPSQGNGDEPNPALKRKWDENDNTADAFNPKYLTSPDLFELEISDLAFRRHILVQGLILMDFLLCQTVSSKKRIESLKVKNARSVIYAFALGDEDAAWISKMRLDITTYLQQGTEGKFYFRMVDTVLSRDKNWVYWKAEGCPKFSRPGVPAQEYIKARDAASGASTSKRIRPTPMGALDLAFLQEKADGEDFPQLKDPERYRLPATDAYRGGIMDDELDIDMAPSDEAKATAIEAKTSKMWRTLRLASRRTFRAFDKVDDGSNLDALFPSAESAEKDEDEVEVEKPSE